MTEPYEHRRARPDDPVPAGVYRVVGVDEQTVTVVAVETPSGRRVHSGRIERVDREVFSALPPASNPDARRGWVRAARSIGTSHPALATAATTLIAIGFVGPFVGVQPETAEWALFAGAGVAVGLVILTRL